MSNDFSGTPGGDAMLDGMGMSAKIRPGNVAVLGGGGVVVLRLLSLLALRYWRYETR